MLSSRSENCNLNEFELLFIGYTDEILLWTCTIARWLMFEKCYMNQLAPGSMGTFVHSLHHMFVILTLVNKETIYEHCLIRKITN